MISLLILPMCGFRKSILKGHELGDRKATKNAARIDFRPTTRQNGVGSSRYMVRNYNFLVTCKLVTAEMQFVALRKLRNSHALLLYRLLSLGL